ncbi:MAG: hypothetical protein JWO92_2520 [Chitinophagaceae bacterium]|nr:hypothetical protein [Chitinophagaceae bacterium]
MSRVLTFSRVFPSYHPKKGEPTLFVEKIWKGLVIANRRDGEYSIWTKVPRLMKEGYWQIPHVWRDQMNDDKFLPKFHTIRAGNRWKVGDKFSPRVWSGKPYNSKQIIIASDIEIKKVWNFEMHEINEQENGYGIYVVINGKEQHLPKQVAINDGLKEKDFYDWFRVKETKPFMGQVICWNEKINY